MVEDEVIEDVTVVGGGDAGLLAALALKKVNPGVRVAVVDDFEDDLPRVGKSTYSVMLEVLHNTLEIPRERFLEEVRPVFKGAVHFRDWGDAPEFFFPFDLQVKFPAVDDPDAADTYARLYEAVVDGEQFRTVGQELAARDRTAYRYDPRQDGYDDVAYHLNTDRYNAFLRTLCRERGIALVDDRIVEVETEGARIETVRGREQAYDADLYVDATGFARVLKGEQESDFLEFDLPVNAAFHAQVERDLDDVHSATVVKGGDYGWFWQIDTYDCRDRGYVFGADYVDYDDALDEFLDEVAGDVDRAAVDTYRWNPGYHEEAWEANCVAIGNAQGFGEPLQSTGLTANAQCAVNLANLLAAHAQVNDAPLREAYNAWVANAWESIADFVTVHYLYAGGDTEFWRDAQRLERSARVERIVEQFDETGFDTRVEPSSTAEGVERPVIFRPFNFYYVMRTLGETSEFYESHDVDPSDDVVESLEREFATVEDRVDGFVDHAELYRGVLEL